VAILGQSKIFKQTLTRMPHQHNERKSTKTSKSMIEQILRPEEQKVKYAVCDIDGVLRGKVIHRAKLEKTLSSGLGFCNVIFGWDSSDVCYDNTQISGWHTGYPDAMARVDLNTLRRVPWDHDLPFFLADFAADPQVAAACPRTLLRKIEEQCSAMGFLAKFALEYEWFNFQDSSQSLQDRSFVNPLPLTPGMFGYSLTRPNQYNHFFNELFDNLLRFEIPIEGLHTETGPGVYEASLMHTTTLEAADRAVQRNGILASFMAKWNDQLPGCGGHIHQNLWSKDGEQNLFLDAEASNGMSQLMQHYIAGQLHCLPHIMPMYAPTVNSYKRLVKGSWAAVSVSWGIENRTAALRVIPNPAFSMRLETRIPGSDANPYLAVAASLASGLYGIKNKLALKTPAISGNAYEQSDATPLPGSLLEATRAMSESGLGDELFGSDFCDHFLLTREWEWEQYSRAVTDWERRRYFEII
jgi:glutamine synthetase